MTATTEPRAAFEQLVELASHGELDEICERYGVRVLSAFGSATQPAGVRPPDDLDLGVSFVDPVLGRRGRIKLWSELVDLTGCEVIDLVVLDIDDPVLRAEALTGFGLYENIRGAFAESQIAAVGERRDTAHLRRMNLELMAR